MGRRRTGVTEGHEETWGDEHAIVLTAVVASRVYTGAIRF